MKTPPPAVFLLSSLLLLGCPADPPTPNKTLARPGRRAPPQPPPKPVAGKGEVEAGEAALKAKDYPKALASFQAAAKLENPDGMYQLGELYFHGTGVKEDNAQAASWHRRAADLGHLPAMWRMGAACWMGIGVTQDRSAGIEWWRKAADAGHPKSMRSLANLYMMGIPGVVGADREEALRLYRKAAAGGDAYSKKVLASQGR